MAIAIKIPPALRKVFVDPESEAAFIDVLNQFQAEQRNGFERTLEMHMQAFKEYLERRLTEADAKNEKRFAELKTALETQIAQSQATFEAKSAQSQATLETKIAQSQATLETKIAQSQTTLIRWMFTFFVGTVIALASLLFTYFQLLVKP